MTSPNNSKQKGLTKKFVEFIELSSPAEARIMLASGMQMSTTLMSGIYDMLPSRISLVPGPGCPESVPTTQEIDKAIKICREKNVIVTAFRDFLRVPGSSSSLQMEQGKGSDVRGIDSAWEALGIAAENGNKKVVLIGTGFEASAATVAAMVLEARRQSIKNLLVFSLHRMLTPGLDVALSTEDSGINGVLCPGHISAVVGCNVYLSTFEKYNIPCVISGLSPLDMLHSLSLLVKQIQDGQAKVQNQFKSAVTFGGNRNALAAMEKVFRPCEQQWRGLGKIPKSGLILRLEFNAFKAESVLDLRVPPVEEHPQCICGDVLAGKSIPLACADFANECIPENPLGPSMASPDGPCSAFHLYLAKESTDSTRSVA